jgi:hypothetical protein
MTLASISDALLRHFSLRKAVTERLSGVGPCKIEPEYSDEKAMAKLLLGDTNERVADQF